MTTIPATYASPGLRWSLLLEDHPGATYAFELASGDELGIPREFGGDGTYCVATITFPGTTDLAPVRAWKPCPARGTPDDWNVLCTKTLGRALKRAGYPDHLPDLKALVLWRQRRAELNAIAAGTSPMPELGDLPARALPAGAGDDSDDADVVDDAELDNGYDGDDPTRPFE